MIWVNIDYVITLHSHIIQCSGGVDGLRDYNLLESAISAPMQSFGGNDLFPSELEKIVRLGFGLASNHAFVDGNKRIGAMVMQLLLNWNGYSIKISQDELADVFIGVADGAVDMPALLRWTQTHLAK